MWPVLVEWNGTIIYSYPLFIGLAWGLGFRFCEAQLPQSISNNKFVIWFVGLFAASWVGAKILFMFTQNQWDVLDLARASNFWLGGGFVFLGGLLAGLLYSFVVGLFVKDLHWTKMSFTMVPLLYSHAVGRIGCFLAGCCYGTETNMPWSIEMHGSHRHPVQLYESLGLLCLGWTLSRPKMKSQQTVWYLLGYGALRWVVEVYRGDEVRGEAIGLSTSQWISIAMLLSGLFLVLRSKVLKNT